MFWWWEIASPRQVAISSLSFINDIMWFECNWLTVFPLYVFFKFPPTISTEDYCEHGHVNKDMFLTLFISNTQYLLNFINVPFLSAENCFKWCPAVLDSAQLDSCYSSKLSAWTFLTKVIIQPCCHSTNMLIFFFIHVYTRHLLSSSVDKDFCLQHDSLKINMNVS